jgi:transcriptional regulator of acetoin/glycerol metabolism
MRTETVMAKPVLPLEPPAPGRGGARAAASGGPAYDQSATMRAWEDFVTARTEGRSRVPVRPVIETSWRRSAELGVDARGRGSRVTLSGDALEALRLRNGDLLRAAASTFERVGAILGDAATMLVITDRSGVILDAGGDRRTIEAGHDIHLEIGAHWGEGETGTNGIGTALVSGQPVYVHAAEHFCEGVKAWTCVGAPIRSPVDGRILGIIDFSGPQDIFHRHNVALGMVAANHIELALAEQMRHERLRVMEACLTRLQRGSGDGFLVLDRHGRLVHHNDAAARHWRALGRDTELAVGSRIADFGEDPSAAAAGEALAGHPVEPLLVDGRFAGAVVVLSARPRPVAATRTPLHGAAAAAVEAARAAIVGGSEALLAALDKVERAAQGRTAILLEGETGVGKELFARLIHAHGQESGKEPFVTFNCGAVSKELIGGELFGHAPGAFTGATREGRPGRFELAHGGVLSLDEIGEMPLDLQPFLLRALEERAIYRLGDGRARPADVRLVASTNRNLKQEVAEGRFRRDLYFRLAAVKIVIPPLRDRGDDIVLLVEHFNRQISSTYDMEPLRFGDEILALLARYSWPGNVRELRNLVENLALMSTSRTVSVADFPEDFVEELSAAPVVGTTAAAVPPAAAQGGGDRDDAGVERLEETERRLIGQAIAASGGNLALAAAKLGVSRSTIYRKVQQYRTGVRRGASADE